MALIANISIDLNKIDKKKIIEGKKGGLYYNLTVMVNDTKDQYENDVSVAEPQTKEQRDAKDKRTYLGNGRVVWQSKYEQTPENSTPAPQTSGGINDLPF